MTLRRLGLIGDIHAEDEYLAAALERLAGEAVDRVLAVGDIVDGRGDVDRCVELLQHHGVQVVRGNHDRWIVCDQMRDLHGATVLDTLAPETCAYLARLLVTRRYETVAGPLLLCHGLGNDDMVFVYDDGRTLYENVDPDGRKGLRTRAGIGIEPDIRLLVGGHTHARMAKTFGRLTVINPGTLHFAFTPCFAVADLGEKVVQFYEIDDNATVMESEAVRIQG